MEKIDNVIESAALKMTDQEVDKAVDPKIFDVFPSVLADDDIECSVS
jgi:hypothetical protein